MKYTATTPINATPEQVWAVLADVQNWPSWSPTMDRVRLLDDGPFGLDSTAEVRQPKLPRTVWRVTAFEPGRRFEWTAGGPGVHTRADHRIDPAAGGCRVTLEIETTGPLAPLLRVLLGGLTRHYVDLEASSLTRHCEPAGSSARPPSDSASW